MPRPVAGVRRIRVVCGRIGVVEIATAHQRLWAHEESTTLAAMRMCHAHGALTNAPACLLEHALHRAHAVGSSVGHGDRCPVLQEVDAGSISQNIGCRRSPAIPALTLVNDKGPTAEPLFTSVEKLRDFHLSRLPGGNCAGEERGASQRHCHLFAAEIRVLPEPGEGEHPKNRTSGSKGRKQALEQSVLPPQLAQIVRLSLGRIQESLVGGSHLQKDARS
mmetsp:Transcript_26255/g.66103  ORF Transcript_26255/g.66103 Transcript_26255/m.66103 type:complete len:220 (+) Transcript_26255:921-1580(+)